MIYTKKSVPLLKISIISLLLICMSLSFVACGSNEQEYIVKGPEKIVAGSQNFTIKKYDIQKSGFKGIENIFCSRLNMPKILSVSSFNAEISKKGILQNFSISFEGYNESKEFVGEYSFDYDGKRKELQYTSPEKNYMKDVTYLYNENNEISFLDSQIKRINFKEQIKELDFSNYFISYNQDTRVNKDQPIIDISNTKKTPVLTWEEYLAGDGGKSDGHTSVIITLYDGTSGISENQINYKCTPKNEETLYGDRNSNMKYDYYANDDELCFTRDWGENWINASISKKDLSETLSFYRAGLEIPEGSYYVSDSADKMIAFFYGGRPKLRITKDDGKSWRDIDFRNNVPELPITRRFVSFTDKNNGYVALGSEWSPGSGQIQLFFVTNDGGNTWTQKQMPDCDNSDTISGVNFCDKKNGIISLTTNGDEQFPRLFCTQNSGDSWIEIKPNWKQLPRDVQFLAKIDSIVYKDNVYTITLSQVPYSNIKAVFKSKSSLLNNWSFVKSYKAVKHTVG